MAPPPGARSWRLLRKTADTFSGYNDPAAAVIVDGTDNYVVDRSSLINGQTYYYKLYWFDGTSWTGTPTVPVAMSATYQDATVDVLMLVRERIEYGLEVEVARGTLKHPQGKIKCLTAFPWDDKTPWPVVTVHLSSSSSDTRAVGEMLEPDHFDGETWDEYEGWYENVQLDVLGWSQNPDERQDLRQAIRRIIIGNLPVFDDAGFLQIGFRQVDAEEPGEPGTIIYKSVGSFSCLAPAQVVGESDESTVITDVELTARSIY